MSKSTNGASPLEGPSFELVPDEHHIEIKGGYVVPKLGLAEFNEYTKARSLEIEYEAATQYAIEAKTPEGMARLERFSRQIDGQCAREDRRRQRAEKLRLSLLEVDEATIRSPLRFIEYLVDVSGGLDSLHNEASSIVRDTSLGHLQSLVGLSWLFEAEWARANAAWFEAHMRQHAVRRVLEYSEFGRWPVEVVGRPDVNLYFVDDNWPDEPEPAPVRRIDAAPQAGAPAGDAGDVPASVPGAFYRRLELAVEAGRANDDLLRGWPALGTAVAAREAGKGGHAVQADAIEKCLRKGIMAKKGWTRLPERYGSLRNFFPLLEEEWEVHGRPRKERAAAGKQDDSRKSGLG